MGFIPLDILRILALIGIIHIAWDVLAVAVMVACFVRAAEERYPGEFG